MSTDQEDDWVQYLAWDQADGHKLYLTLAGSRGFDQEQTLLGYTCVDQETYLAFVEVTIHGIGQMYQTDGKCPLWLRLCLAVDADSLELEWKLQAISTNHPHEFLGSRFKMVDSLQELERTSRLLKGADVRGTPTNVLQDGVVEEEDRPEDPDDYWGQYDQEEETESTREQGSDANSEDYYDRYATQVETAIQAPEVPQPDGDGARAEEDNARPALLPDIVHHAESSLRSLRRLCRAAGLADDQMYAIYRKVMDEPL
ncbi:protein of unknown function [Taphrina deformans PYCC 5710]|uniref:Uncharacterized protein n=1 Tax=Taphrina deformans (strain PYCC 5710 / ATCC 11124 / CBS 356.35 / IMI 108563 / JCM 9778 / NBRC 8474) TaxID=1097556 RepID=R4XFF0_TAPDE|nr:protein of unknown function [Taphrina deformans PYCC 5710]|eukprot:CCG84398.1 protein of unknown function [Taphrina deformans PYCC 5710]